MRSIYKNSSLIILCSILAYFLSSCSKDTKLADDPYGGGKGVLDINFISKRTDPEIVRIGSVLELKVNGLMKYKDNFKVYVNEVEADVLNYTDSTLRFEVPVGASTGSMWITTGEQVFFGPLVKVGGKVSVDASFKVVNGAARLGGGSATVYDIQQNPNGRFWLVGEFDNYEQKGTEDKPNGGIAQIDAEGAYSTSDVSFGIGVVGGARSIYSISRITEGTHSGKFIVGGFFSAYNTKRNNRQTINNITRLTAKGELDTMMTSQRDASGNSLVPIINPDLDKKWKDQDTVPSFNGGVDGVVRKTLIHGEQVYVLGIFENYMRTYYPNSTYDEKVYDVTRMRNMVRLKLDGSMDSTFHFNPQKKQSEMAGNGGISDAIVQSDGKLIIVGSFTTFNGKPANHIVRLNLDGSVDESFNAGTGANEDIYSIRYNANTNKITIAGRFTRYNGVEYTGVALLNPDGSLDQSFKPGRIIGGIASFAAQLNDGKMLVTGSFNYYDDHVRQGLMILNANGKLAEGYNNTGGFQGRVFDMVETSTSTGARVTLVGDISRFNGTFPNNVLRLFIAD